MAVSSLIVHAFNNSDDYPREPRYAAAAAHKPLRAEALSNLAKTAIRFAKFVKTRQSR